MFNKERRSEFKKGIDSSEQRRKRTENTIELRKNKREEQLVKRRVLGDTPFGNENNPGQSENAKPNTEKASNDEKYEVKDLERLVEQAKSEDADVVVKAVRGIRKLLSIESNPPIDEVINTGITPHLVKMLSYVKYPLLVFEVAWVLTNMASGTSKHVQYLMEKCNVVQNFIAVLNTPNLTADVYDQAAWALGNIAGDNWRCRDFVLQCGALPTLLRLCQSRVGNTSRLRDAVWVISNMCRGKPQPKFELIKDAVPVLAAVMATEDVEVLTDACWALSYLSDDMSPNNEKIQAVIDSNVVPRIVELLKHQSINIKTPALRTMGNIVTGNDVQTQYVLNLGLLGTLKAIMNSSKKNIRKEVCWTISNITAGTPQQIQAVVDADIMGPIVQFLSKSEYDIKKEAAWLITNVVAGGCDEQIRYVAKFDVLPALCDLLESKESQLMGSCMDAIYGIMALGKKDASLRGGENAYAVVLEQCGGVERLDALLESENDEVVSKARRILDEFFEAEDDGAAADAGLAPAIQNKSQFAFGSSSGSNDLFSFGDSSAAATTTFSFGSAAPSAQAPFSFNI